MSNKIVKGTLLLTGAAFLSKFLGMIYIIPFNELVGPKGGALYYYAYNPYTVLIGVSTVGVPLAVSKIVSKYNSLGYHKTGIRVFKASLLLMTITGILAFVVLYFSSDWLASWFASSDEHGNTVEEVSTVIKMVSFALLIIPAMGAFRGFFQGNQRMEPTAISQVVEQIVRIIFVLVSVFIVIKVMDGTIATAVSYATFAAFIGAVASFAILLFFWKKIRPTLSDDIYKQQKALDISSKELSLELLSYAGPFIFVGIAIPLYQMIDSFTFNKAMAVAGNEKISEFTLTAINMYGHKLISIPITIATGLSLTIVPALTQSFTTYNRQNLNKEINQALQVVFLLMIPAVVGLSTLSYEAYGSLFGMVKLSITGNLLAWYAPVALLFGLFSVTAAILQGINEQRFAFLSLTVGFLIKLVCNSTFIHLLGAKGSILATALAVGVAVFLNLVKIQRAIQFNFMQTIKRGLFMVIFSGVMCLSIYLLKLLFGLFLPYDSSRFAATIMLGIGIIGGAVVYVYLIYASTLLEAVLGDMKVFRRFRRKKHAPR